ncbi:MAG: hypothetical protein WAK07_21815 [Rhodomicrobium sp.]
MSCKLLARAKPGLQQPRGDEKFLDINEEYSPIHGTIHWGHDPVMSLR